MLKFLLIAFLATGTSTASAQEPDSTFPSLDISKVRFYDLIPNSCLYTNTAPGAVPEANIPNLPFRKKQVIKYFRSVPGHLMERDNYLQFYLYNSSDTVRTVCMLPAIYCSDIKLYKAGIDNPAATFHKISDKPDQANVGVSYITLLPGESAVFYCKFNFVRTNVNSFIPRLVEKDLLEQYISVLKNRDRMLDVFTYIVSGILLLMIFYSLSVYLQSRNKEFIYYAIYTLCTVALMFLKSFLNYSTSNFNYFYEEYLDFMIMSGAVFCYMYFIRKFINTAKKHPPLDKFLRIANWTLLALCAVFSCIYFFTPDFITLSILENYVIKMFFILTGIVFIVYSFRHKDPLLNYLAAGNVALIIFSLISFLIMMFKWKLVSSDDPTSPALILNRSMFYYEIGLVLELGFFLAGLAYKNRRDIIESVKERERLKLDNERKEFDKQLAVVTAKQEERDRISADMHDELGSGMTAIRLMSEIMKSKMKNNSFPELEKISSSANDLLGKMDTIIWTMKSSNDTLESLVAYIRAHAIEYFDNTPIDCTVSMPAAIPPVDMTGEKRRNIFLGIKEALNNAMKHSQATKIHIEITADDGALTICITDNGIGIDEDKLRRFGNGLSNMRRRMENIGGSLTVESHGHCRITFHIPLQREHA